MSRRRGSRRSELGTSAPVRQLGQPAGLVEQVVAGCLQMTVQIILIPVFAVETAGIVKSNTVL